MKLVYRQKDRRKFKEEIRQCKSQKELNVYKWALEQRPVASLTVLISLLVAAFSVAMAYCTTPVGYVLQEDAQLYGHKDDTLPLLAEAFGDNLEALNQQLVNLVLITITLAVIIYCGWRNHRNYHDFCIDTVKNRELQFIKETESHKKLQQQ